MQASALRLPDSVHLGESTRDCSVVRIGVWYPRWFVRVVPRSLSSSRCSVHIFLNWLSIRHADHKPTGLDWRQTARAIHRTKGKRLARPDRTDVVTRTIVVTKGIVHVEATRRKSHHSKRRVTDACAI